MTELEKKYSKFINNLRNDFKNHKKQINILEKFIINDKRKKKIKAIFSDK